MWRRRELNPRPQDLRQRVYMLIGDLLFNSTHPDQSGYEERAQLFLTARARAA